MSRTLINNYLKDLDIIKTASGTVREGVVSEAFKDLLKAYARAQNLIFLNQYELPPQDGKRRYVDGALVYDVRLAFGYWEAKDEEDDLDKEIAAKFRRGYPRDNIIFEDSRSAVLFQNGNEVMRCRIDDMERIEHLLALFFGYERPEITQFRKAVVQFQTDLGGVPKAAFAYRLGNRSALDWILDQHKEKTPKDPTIREKFNTYRFADHKDRVIDLLKRVTRVSVETMEIVEAMREEGSRQ
jgi:hypothetical protein